MSASARAPEQGFWREHQEKLGALRGNASAWQEYIEESEGLGAPLADGLERDDDWGWLSDVAKPDCWSWRTIREPARRSVRRL